MAIKNTTLTATTEDLVYQSDGQSAVTAIYFCNIGTTPEQINVYAVPTTGVGIADLSNIIYSKLTIAPDDTYIIDTEKLILDNGDRVYAKALTTPDVIVTTVSYVGI